MEVSIWLVCHQVEDIHCESSHAMASQTFSIAPKSEQAAFGNRGEEPTNVAEEGEDGDYEDRLNSCQVDKDDRDEDNNNEKHVNIWQIVIKSFLPWLRVLLTLCSS